MSTCFLLGGGRKTDPVEEEGVAGADKEEDVADDVEDVADVP